MILQIKTTVEGRTDGALSSLFTLNLRDPCLTTELVHQDLEDMATTQNAPDAVTQTFQRFQDTVSLEYGDGSGHDLCGEQTYELK